MFPVMLPLCNGFPLLLIGERAFCHVLVERLILCNYRQLNTCLPNLIIWNLFRSMEQQKETCRVQLLFIQTHHLSQMNHDLVVYFCS